MSNQPSKTSGAYHNVKGNAKEALGSVMPGTLGQGLQNQGLEEQAHGEHQYDAARIKGHNEAAANAVVGKTEAEAGAFKGDNTQQKKGELQQERAEKQQEINRSVN